jgi:hypothetical protein
LDSSVSSTAAAQPAWVAQATYEAFIKSHAEMHAKMSSAISSTDVVSLGARQDALEQDVAQAASSLPDNVSFESVLSSSLDLGQVMARMEESSAADAVREGTFSRATQLYLADPNGGPVGSVTTAGGLRVDVTSIIHDAKGNPSASVAVNRANGPDISFEAGDNVRINEREDGSLAVAVAGSGIIRVYAADGSMTTEQCEQDAQGTDGNDVFLLLRSGSIDAGAGDDTILVLTGGTLSIDAGDGNDAVIFSDIAPARSHHSGVTIYGGGGNDTVSGHSVENALVDLGDGDNSINMHNVGDSSLVLSDGDNSINVRSMRDSSLALGDGGNSINMHSLTNSSLILGDGDNDITLWNLTKDSITAESSITAGNGNNTFRWWSLDNGEVSFGNGDNTFVGWSMLDQDASFSAGDGNNKFSLGSVFSGMPTVTLGDGDNTVNFGNRCPVNLITGRGKLFGANRWSDTVGTQGHNSVVETAKSEMKAHHQFMHEWERSLGWA